MDKTLNLIEHAIIHMLRSGKLPQKANRKSGIGRLIVDEWPMDSQLGNQILDALSAYHTF